MCVFICKLYLYLWFFLCLYLCLCLWAFYWPGQRHAFDCWVHLTWTTNVVIFYAPFSNDINPKSRTVFTKKILFPHRKPMSVFPVGELEILFSHCCRWFLILFYKTPTFSINNFYSFTLTWSSILIQYISRIFTFQLN